MMNQKSKQMVVANWMKAYNTNSVKASKEAAQSFKGFGNRLATLLHKFNADVAFRKAIEASL